MPKVYWEEIYSVNVKEIDNQHKDLVGFVNEVYEKLDSDASPDAFVNFFDSLTAHAHLHFSTEEKYFGQFDFSDAEEHIMQHNAIKDKIAELKNRYDEKRDLSIIFETIQFLDDWIFTHIMNFDKKYVKCFNEHGLY